MNKQRRADLLERFELDPRKKGRTYSKGNRQKVALVAALSSDVELLILDEPTSGLDPLMEAVFQDCINDERERGRTVLLSSHILAEAEALCDRVSDHPQRPHRRDRHARRHAAPDPHVDLRGARRPAERSRRRWPGCTTSSPRATASGSRSTRTSSTSCSSSSSSTGVRTLTSQPPTLEELFLRHYEDTK